MFGGYPFRPIFLKNSQRTPEWLSKYHHPGTRMVFLFFCPGMVIFLSIMVCNLFCGLFALHWKILIPNKRVLCKLYVNGCVQSSHPDVPERVSSQVKICFPAGHPAAFFLESPASLVRNSYLNRTQFPELLSVLSPLLPSSPTIVSPQASDCV